MNSTLSFEEEAAILFSSSVLCIGSVVAFAFFLLQITNNKSNKTNKWDCCFFTLLRLVWKKCCKCSGLNQELKKHLKEEGGEEEEETL